MIVRFFSRYNNDFVDVQAEEYTSSLLRIAYHQKMALLESGKVDECCLSLLLRVYVCVCVCVLSSCDEFF